MAISTLQPLKSLNASHTQDLTEEEFSFELSWVMLQGDYIFMMMI